MNFASNPRFMRPLLLFCAPHPRTRATRPPHASSHGALPLPPRCIPHHRPRATRAPPPAPPQCAAWHRAIFARALPVRRDDRPPPPVGAPHPPGSHPTAITPAKIARALRPCPVVRSHCGRARCPHRAAITHAKFAHALPTATGRCGAMIGRHRPWGLPTLPARTRPLITPAKLAGALFGPPGTCRRSGEGGYFFICSRVRVAICSTVTSP